MPHKFALGLVAACVIIAGCASTGPAVRNRDQALPQESAATQRRNAAEIHTELGQRYMQRGQLKTALGKLQKALSFDASYVPAHTVIAVLYARIGKPALAEKHYRRAQKLAPTKGSVNNNLGQFLCKMGRVRESLIYFGNALDDPFYKTPGVALVNAGTCLARINRLDEAIAKFNAALAINPADADALLAMAKALTGKQDYFHARAFIERFTDLRQPRPAALLLGYTIETQLGEREAARKYANELREKFPDSPQARSLQGQHSS